MVDPLKRITGRIKQLFASERAASPTAHTEQKKTVASQIIKPEQLLTDKPLDTIIDQTQKPSNYRVVVQTEVLHNGVVHVWFTRVAAPKVVDVVDPITKKSERRLLGEGLTTKSVFYDDFGNLIDEGSGVGWC